MDSPTAAYQAMVSQYASVGGLAVLTWDIIDNIPEDYNILFKKQQRKLSIPSIIYILSRVGAFSYALISVIFDTAPIGHCALVDALALAWCPISFGATALLFLLRLRAVYNGNRFVVSIFSVLWLFVLVGAALDPVSTKGGPLIRPGRTVVGYCTNVSVTPLSFYGALAPLVFDTLVWLAISWRISTISLSDEPHANIGKRLYAMFFGTNLPAFTRGLLIDGQIYYLITVATGVACAVLFFSPRIPAPLSGLLEDIYPAVVNIMACRLFRRTKSGAIREAEVSHTVANHITCSTIQISINTSSHTESDSKGEALSV